MYQRVDLRQYCVISIWFGCNSSCGICMLSRSRTELPALQFERFRDVVLDIAASGRFENLILSGGEVTTFTNLDEYVRFAASLRFFKKIQIQTNGRMLADTSYARNLVQAGVNEFFVSIHGLDGIHDAMVGHIGAFSETMKGIENVTIHDGVNIISNTVLTNANLAAVPDLFRTLADTAISEIHLWNYFPMERTDSRGYVAAMKDFVAMLPEILSVGRQSGKAIVFKSFPSCLSQGEPGFFDGYFPATVLPDKFWREFSECGFGACIYRQRKMCDVKDCWGLSSAYVAKYGFDEQLLHPVVP
jgi:molybdenum cofactor biosynthesis enzyme MoaA